MSSVMLVIAASVFLVFLLLIHLFAVKEQDPLYVFFGGLFVLVAFFTLSLIFDQTHSWSEQCRKDISIALKDSRFSVSDIKTINEFVCKD